MKKFAKLIELKDGAQVLLTVDFCDKDDTYEVKIRTDLNGISTSMKLGYDDESNALELLEKYDVLDAERYILHVENLMK